jgi:hypothetical protein
MNAIMVSLPFTHPSINTDVEHDDVQEGRYAMQRRTACKPGLKSDCGDRKLPVADTSTQTRPHVLSADDIRETPAA